MDRNNITKLVIGMLLAVAICVFAFFRKQNDLVWPSLAWPIAYLATVLIFYQKKPVYQVLWLYMIAVAGAWGCLQFRKMYASTTMFDDFFSRVRSLFGNEKSNWWILLTSLAVIIFPGLFSQKNEALPLLTTLRYGVLIFLLVFFSRAMPSMSAELACCIAGFGLLHELSTGQAKGVERRLFISVLRILVFCLFLPALFRFMTTDIYMVFLMPGILPVLLAVFFSAACLLGAKGMDDPQHSVIGLTESQLVAVYLLAFAVLDLLMWLFPNFYQPHVLFLGLPMTRVVMEYVYRRKSETKNHKSPVRDALMTLPVFMSLSIIALLALARGIRNESGRYPNTWSLPLLLTAMMLLWYFFAYIIKWKRPSRAMSYFWGTNSLLLFFSLDRLDSVVPVRWIVMAGCIIMWWLLYAVLPRNKQITASKNQTEFIVPFGIMNYSPAVLLTISMLVLLISG